MKPLYAFTIITLIWTVADFVSKKTKSLVSSLLVASIIFLIGFKSNILPEDFLSSSSLLSLGSTVLGFIIIHIGSMVSIKDLKNQWKTVVVGVSATIGIDVFLLLGNSIKGGLNYAIAAAGVTGGPF